MDEEISEEEGLQTNRALLPRRTPTHQKLLFQFLHQFPDPPRHELLHVLYPVFIHCFMDLVAKGHIQEARAFFASFREDHEMMHLLDLQKLEGVLSPSHLEAMEFAYSLRQSKVNIKICQGENDLAPSENMLGSNGGKRSYTLYQGHSGAVYSATFSPFWDFLLSSLSDSTIRLWSTKLNANLVCYKGHNYPVWDVQLCEGALLASGFTDYTVKFWDVTTSTRASKTEEKQQKWKFHQQTQIIEDYLPNPLQLQLRLHLDEIHGFKNVKDCIEIY